MVESIGIIAIVFIVCAAFYWNHRVEKIKSEVADICVKLKHINERINKVKERINKEEK